MTQEGWFSMRLMRRTDPSRRPREQGMTIVEVVVVVAIMAVMIPVFALTLIGSYRDSYYSNERVQATNQIMQALQYMEDGVRSAHTYLVSVPSPFTDAYGPHNSGTSGAEAWSYKGDSSTSRVLIIESYATTQSALSTGRRSVYRSDGSYNCTTQKQYQPKLDYLTIFFVRNGNLYRRLLTDTTSPLCAGESQAELQTCPPEIPTGSLDPSCEARDELLVANVSGFVVTYWQDTYLNQIDAYNSSDPTILEGADYITVDLTTSTHSGQVVETLTQRMTKVNR